MTVQSISISIMVRFAIIDITGSARCIKGVPWDVESSSHPYTNIYLLYMWYRCILSVTGTIEAFHNGNYNTF